MLHLNAMRAVALIERKKTASVNGHEKTPLQAIFIESLHADKTTHKLREQVLHLGNVETLQQHGQRVRVSHGILVAPRQGSQVVEKVFPVAFPTELISALQMQEIHRESTPHQMAQSIMSGLGISWIFHPSKPLGQLAKKVTHRLEEHLS